MRLSAKLLGFLNRAFSKDPDAFLAFRMRYNGNGMTWTVFDGQLVVAVVGGSGRGFTVALAGHSIASLATFISIQPGFAVPYAAADLALSASSALCLVEASGDQNTSNGDHLTAYTSLLFAYVDTMAVELALAEAAVVAMPDQMVIGRAAGSWVDFLGSFYNIPRNGLEPDAAYAIRIIVEVLRPLSNNLAIEDAIATFTGQQVRVIDAAIYRQPEPNFSGIPSWNGYYKFQPATTPAYGLFDAIADYDLLGGDVPTDFLVALKKLIFRLRAAGTHLRSLTLGNSALGDTAYRPTDDQDFLVIGHLRRFDGFRPFGGQIQFGGNIQEVGTIEVTSYSVQIDPVIGVTVAVRGVPVQVGIASADVAIALTAGAAQGLIGGALLVGYADGTQIVGADGDLLTGFSLPP